MSSKWHELPEDVLFIVFQSLDRHALRALRLVHRTYEKPATVTLFAEIHLSPSLMSFQRMADVAASRDLSHLVQRIVYHPKPERMEFVNQPYWFQRELCRLRAKVLELSEAMVKGPGRVLRFEDIDELEGEIAELRFNIYITTPPSLLGALPFHSDQVWQLYDKYMNETLTQKSCQKLASSRGFRKQIDQTSSTFVNLKHLQLCLNSGERPEKGPCRLDKTFHTLLRSKVGSLPLSLSGLQVERPEFTELVGCLPLPTRSIENLHDLRLGCSDAARGQSSGDWSRLCRTIGEFVQVARQLRSLDLDFGPAPDTLKTSVAHFGDATSEATLCGRWPHLQRLRLRGAVLGGSAFDAFVESHAKTIRVLELGDITLCAEWKDGAMSYPPARPSVFRFLAQIQSSFSLEHVRLRGGFSNGDDEVWWTTPRDWLRETIQGTILARLEHSLCRGKGSPSAGLAEAFDAAEPIGAQEQMDREPPDYTWWRMLRRSEIDHREWA